MGAARFIGVLRRDQIPPRLRRLLWGLLANGIYWIWCCSGIPDILCNCHGKFSTELSAQMVDWSGFAVSTFCSYRDRSSSKSYDPVIKNIEMIMTVVDLCSWVQCSDFVNAIFPQSEHSTDFEKSRTWKVDQISPIIICPGYVGGSYFSDVNVKSCPRMKYISESIGLAFYQTWWIDFGNYREYLCILSDMMINQRVLSLPKVSRGMHEE